MGQILQGTIVKVDAEGYTIRTTTPPNVDQLIHREYEEVRVELIDGRHCTPSQLRKAWAIMADIAKFNEDDKQEVYRDLRHDFTLRRVDTLQKNLFHLSSATVTDAREFISYLVDLCMEYGIENANLLENNDDIQHYVYACAINKRCAVCGKSPADLHHVDRVGMGRNRDTINHIGMEAITLCRAHHQELHQHGDQHILTQYHLQPLTIDERIARIYKLGKVKK